MLEIIARLASTKRIADRYIICKACHSMKKWEQMLPKQFSKTHCTRSVVLWEAETTAVLHTMPLEKCMILVRSALIKQRSGHGVTVSMADFHSADSGSTPDGRILFCAFHRLLRC